MCTTGAPLLKWAGGKRWLAPAITKLFSDLPGKHIEPFAGGAACFFASTKKGVLSDANKDLIQCYEAVRRNAGAIARAMSTMEVSPAAFANIRSSAPTSPLDRAVRFLYLNRTAFNGLYRVNKLGQFNVPFGCKPTTRLAEPELLHACSSRLAHAQLLHADYRRACEMAAFGDGVYLDPPYTVLHNNNGFRRYNEHMFSWRDQVGLADTASELCSRGMSVIVSNAFHDDVRRLYSQQHFYAYAIRRASNMAASSSHRGLLQELLLVSKTLAPTKKDITHLLRSVLPNSVTPISLRERRLSM